MMKIDLNAIPENFIKREVDFCGENCYLIFPQHIGVKWTKENLIFRSSVWNGEGDLISAGFPKFGNLGENPDVFGYPKSLKDSHILTKLDGSLLIVSSYKDKLIVRTRGTIDAKSLENGNEIELLKEKYPKAFQYTLDHSDVSLLFEWTTPNNRIVIKYNEVDITLLGVVNHKDYSLLNQIDVSIVANEIGVDRPDFHEFESLEDLQSQISSWKQKEGVVIYTSSGKLYKAKAQDYLIRHRLKDELGSFERIVDFYFTQGRPNYNDFYAAIIDAVDWETAEECRGDISRIVNGMKEVHKIIEHMNKFVDSVRSSSRKDAAFEIKSAYGTTNRCGYAFRLLDNHPLDDDAYKKLLYQVLKK